MKALKAAGLRVPKDASEDERELADRAFARIVDVMEEQVPGARMFPVLQAARVVREEICGKVAEKHEHSGTVYVVSDATAGFDK